MVVDSSQAVGTAGNASGPLGVVKRMSRHHNQNVSHRATAGTVRT